MSEKSCPFCGEKVRAEAIKCRFCASRLDGGLRSPLEWHRGYPERRVAGVCASVAHHLGVSVSAVRAAFVLLAFLHGSGVVLYLALWALLPPERGASSLLDRISDALRGLLGGACCAGRGQPGSRSSGAPGADGKKAGGWSPTRS